MHRYRPVLDRKHSAMTDRRLAEMLESAYSRPKRNSLTWDEWKQLLQQLQQEATMKNREHGMELPKWRR